MCLAIATEQSCNGIDKGGNVDCMNVWEFYREIYAWLVFCCMAQCCARSAGVPADSVMVVCSNYSMLPFCAWFYLRQSGHRLAKKYAATSVFGTSSAIVPSLVMATRHDLYISIATRSLGDSSRMSIHFIWGKTLTKGYSPVAGSTARPREASLQAFKLLTFVISCNHMLFTLHFPPSIGDSHAISLPEMCNRRRGHIDCRVPSPGPFKQVPSQPRTATRRHWWRERRNGNGGRSQGWSEKECFDANNCFIGEQYRTTSEGVWSGTGWTTNETGRPGRGREGGRSRHSGHRRNSSSGSCGDYGATRCPCRPGRGKRSETNTSPTKRSFSAICLHRTWYSRNRQSTRYSNSRTRYVTGAASPYIRGRSKVNSTN